ncbi:MAG: hypothetical protein ACF8OB_01035 [Phycisphaeraceae bacterium JB051]
MPTSKFRFYVCRECGPKGLFNQLCTLKQKLADDDIQIEVYNSICLSACKFNRVVKVQIPDGTILSYSDKEMNGFRKWDEEPLIQLTHECMPITHTV